MWKKEGRKGEPMADKWYTLTLGSSFIVPHPRSSPNVCTLRYDFVPASVDKSQPGSLHRKKDKVNVELNHIQPNKPKFIFEGTGEDLKENDAVMYFDGNSFRLERVHRAVKRLKYSRLVEHTSAAVLDASSPPVGRGPGKSQPSVGNNRVASLTPPQSHQALTPPLPLPPVLVEVERIEIGEVGRIDAGDIEKIDIGEDEQIDIGEDEQIDIGEVERINVGEVERIDVGEVERIDGGEVERIDIGDAVMFGGKSRNNKSISPPSEHNATLSPNSKDFDLEAHLDIMNDADDEACGPDKNAAEGNPFTGIDINIPHQNDTDDEIADVDVNDDNGVMVGNAAAALKALVHRQEKDDQSSSSSASSGSESSSSSSSRSSSRGRSSSDSDSSDDNSVNSV